MADGTRAIDREVLAAGIDQDCVAFNQYVGVGLNQVPGYLTGECFGRAVVRVDGAMAPRTRLAPRHCGAEGSRSTDPGPLPPRLVVPAPGRATIEGRARDPWGRAPETGSVGERRTFVPPWRLLVWRGADGSTCYEPGQYVDRHTPGRSDQLPGVRPVGPLRRGRLVGTLRYDSRSGPGIQLYGIGRFVEYPRAEGGSCGDPRAGAGLIFFWETELARPDLNLGVTIVSGVAGPGIASVAVAVAGRPRPLPLGSRRAFIAVFRGDVPPRELPLTVRYRDGGTRTFAA